MSRLTRTFVIAGVAISMLLLIVGCASIITGTSAKMSVTSNPSQASVNVLRTGGQKVFEGATPANFKLPRSSKYSMNIKLAGYKEQTVQIGQEFNTWYLGNLICGGILGLIIDAVDGAMWNLEPNQVHVEMVTAMLDGKTQLYAVLGALDSDGQLRTIAIPMVPDVDSWQ
jgi:hypothetical protein